MKILPAIRIVFCCTSVILLWLLLMATAGAEQESVVVEKRFDKDVLHTMAAELADKPYAPRPRIPKPWLDLSYDEFNHIWFNSRNAIWMDEDRPFKMDLFTAGLYHERPTEINILQNGISNTLDYDLSLFDTTDQFPDLPVDGTMGYSGFRLRAELSKPDIFTEFFLFQGASYFRGIATGQTYGLSARGLALKTAHPDGEEFPDFTKFWVKAAEPGEKLVTVYALLDSPSTTGAYTFVITPGVPAKVSVDATLFPRTDLTHVGLGPLTSMFFFDETNRHRFDDFRPAVHDSEALMVWNGNGEVLWRPLANPARLQVSSFVDNNPKGFGLMQRNRRAEDFADLEAHYQNRPSLWITPGEAWGRGTVELVEIPADKEIYDNIVAYWRPREPLNAGDEHSFSYTMQWGEDPQGTPDLARVTNTRIGKGFDQVKNVVAIDFTDHPDIPDDLSDIQLTLRSNTGKLSKGILQHNPGTGGVRLVFSFLPGDAKAVEMRAQLRTSGKPISEVWLYRWTQ